MKKIFSVFTAIFMAFAILCSTAFADSIRFYAEPQYGYVTTSTLTVRSEPNRNSSAVVKLTNALPMVVLGKVSNGSEEFYAVSLRSVGVDMDGYGYVLVPGVYLGMREYIKVEKKIWARAQQSTSAVAVAEISPGENRKVLERSMVDGELWYSIQVEESHRGVGFVRARDVSNPFYLDEDVTFVKTFSSGNQVAKVQTSAKEESNIVTDNTSDFSVVDASNTDNNDTPKTVKSNITAGMNVTVNQKTVVRSAGADDAKQTGELQPGTQVYVYQVSGNYAMIVFNGSFGYVPLNVLQ